MPDTPEPLYNPPKGEPGGNVNAAQLIQTVPGLNADNVTTGKGFTITVDIAVTEQPPVVPLTV